MGKKIEFEIEAMGKPRMTRSDQWRTRGHPNPKKRMRECVERFWDYKDALKKESFKKGFVMPESGYHLTFILPISQSWSKKKKVEMIGKPHRMKPDKDNLEKGFLDSILKEDSVVWDGRVTKLWGEKGKIIIEFLDEEERKAA